MVTLGIVPIVTITTRTSKKDTVAARSAAARNSPGYHMNIKWTKIPDPEFKQEMFKTAHVLQDMMLSTSGCEEGMNVLLTVLASLIASFSSENWNLLMHTATCGVQDADEKEVAEMCAVLFRSLDKLRDMSLMSKSKYIAPALGTASDKPFTCKAPRLPS